MGMGNGKCCTRQVRWLASTVSRHLADPLLPSFFSCKPQANSDHFDLTRLLTCRYTNKPISEARFGSARRTRCYARRTKQNGLEIAKVQPTDNQSSDPAHCVLSCPVLYAGALIDARTAGTDPGLAQSCAAQRSAAPLLHLCFCYVTACSPVFAERAVLGLAWPGLAWDGDRAGPVEK
ncbi:hypothetical protein CEP54_015334 [Fusarium duplospermum]|uniref:Uncharacterized protein n=1 Tax=Fusarium duplospermum TaxID=1325734 RepID=A0A428NPU4_9HYPO|nr:hypothetical protein CEP54_015334 [Fusarium duplospermum]